MSQKDIELVSCPVCSGEGCRNGIFQFVICFACNGLGKVRADDNEPLPNQQIIDRLVIRNQKLQRYIQELSSLAHTLEPTAVELQRKWRGA